MTALLPLPTTPSLRLDGQRALVTGGGRGLGTACAAALAAAGAEVAVVARSRDDVEAVAGAIVAAGALASPMVLDVTDIGAAAAMIAEAGPFDILVNNAGMNRPAAFVDVTPAEFDAVAGLNLRAAFFVAQAVAKGLIEAGRPGSIINMSSQMGLVGSATRSVYCTTKHGLIGLTKAMAIELAPHGIRVNALCPTFIETPMTRPFLADPSFHARIMGMIKLGRLGKPEDLMGAVVFLASDAASLMTGSALVIDGGWTAE